MKPLSEAEQLYNSGLDHHRAGRLDQAIALYQQAIAKRPDFFEANLNLAVILHDSGDLEGAIKRYRRVLEIRPNVPEIYNNLGNALRLAKRHKEAVKSLMKAVRLNPDYAEAHNNLGIVLMEIGQPQAALDHFEKALAIRADYPNARLNLGVALMQVGRWDDAESALERYLIMEPGNAMAWNELAKVHFARHDYARAIRFLEKALQIDPTCYECLVVMADVFLTQGNMEEAYAWYRKATELHPQRSEGFLGRGNAAQHLERFVEAIHAYETAIQLDPGAVHARNNLGILYAHAGQLKEGVRMTKETLDLLPDIPAFQSNWLFTLGYQPEVSAEQLADAHRNFGKTFENPAIWPAYLRDTEPERRLRIGYVSPDFRNHVCRFFIEPLLAHHDKNRVEVFLYGEVPHPDEATRRMQNDADHWYSTVGKSDQEVIEQVQSDRIDILVDLGGHTAASRLLFFAKKPAPIQVTWPMGTANTSGLTAIDYILLDRHMAPEGKEHLFSEKVFRLAGPHLAYRPPDYAPPVADLPAKRNGFITFGCFSRPIRLNDRVIALWARVLHAVSGSRLLLNARAFAETPVQAQMVERFSRHDIPSDRLVFHVTKDSIATLSAYDLIDLTLDPFPQNAGTTNYEALWMGVPVITLRSRPPLGCLTTSLLNHVGRPEWVAQNQDDYVRIAQGLAQDVPALSHTRQTLRAQFAASRILDEARFARDMESHYREMWRRWCRLPG